ncbi:hypothetical protein [Sphingobium sp. Cam5-1]|uniref:hypothetical protein n=1 Tax=Sphingobium sp. Cam5-1 TaxID=2789327 RepID=UPI0018AD2DC9|nr:hypothetical protein [Sphingobium sp. Cam5-1]QPI73904.1 hypothetical protein IZV00_05415 [Sphingobium sp. Cam5-1]
MPQDSFHVGSAFAEALTKANALMREPKFCSYRTIDLVNIGKHSVGLAHQFLPSDPALTRIHLIHAASRLIAAAERLEHPEPVAVLPSDRPENSTLLVVS